MAWITFSYNGGLRNNYNVALKLHDKYQIPASLGIVAHRAVTPQFWESYMSPKEIVDAESRGHEIASNGYFHESKLTEMSDSELEFEVAYSKELLEGISFQDISTFYVPYSIYDDRVTRAASKFYKRVRVAGGKYNKVGEKYFLVSSFVINSKTSIESVKSLIDKAVSEDQWLVLMLHGTVNGAAPKGLYSTSEVFLDSVLSYVREYVLEKSLLPVTFQDSLKYQDNNFTFRGGFDGARVLAEGDGYLITYHLPKVKSNKLLISFGGLPSGKTPTGFGSDFAIKSGYHHIFVAQAPGTQYQGLSLEVFRDSVALVCKEKDVYTYGSSLGGYCAIYYAGVIDAQAIAAAPKNSAHPTLSYNLKKPVAFRHLEISAAPKSSKKPIVIYDPYQKEESKFIDNQIIPAYPDLKRVKVPYSGHLVLQVMSRNGTLKPFMQNVIERGEVSEVKYDVESCHVWHYEKARVLFKEEYYFDCMRHLERSIALYETNAAKELMKKVQKVI